MDIILKKVEVSKKEILRNLMEKHLYESSQYDKSPVNELGLYGYEYFDYYWVEKSWQAYFIVVDGRIAGFTMINTDQIIDIETQYTLAEFFLTYPYRNKGIGKYILSKLFLKYRGSWQLQYHPKNRDVKKFWKSIIKDFSGDAFTLYEKHPEAEYFDGIFGDVFVFTT